ncbi:glycosyl hydrolase family 61-domain-containing protein [Colletotrichum phormii]|uniref:lytic cellulose monooxygenase (C4-dehydrogenating) n=1 Tax=Colletotrichum phormii TaxID=359342 RepID=A0AAI9ZW47_9PEZI|nr:glycosyl hydrolase family 61-domain-containing protein [Colletotrichum phormii]KAK1637934.1 glycosyl hydrolase family 61-domain-containing protein [Colletotrichum phormii]
MGNRKKTGLLAVLASAASVTAHGHVTNIVVNGVSYRNYIPVQDPYINNPPLVAGWTIDQRDNGFVAPDAYNAPDIICHRQAVPGKGRITVAAGDTVQLQWTEWPDSHKGPVMDFLANCNGPCNAVDKTALKFFKIDGAGLINPPQQTNQWAATVLINNGNAWSVRIPPNVAPGHYVLRHDIIALHSAGQQNGAQSYPQCVNLEITGSGTDNPAGTPGTALYGANDPGILYNIYRDNLNDYVIPGGAIIPGGVSMLPQSRIQITASGSATPYGTTIRASSTITASASVPTSSSVVPSRSSSTISFGNSTSDTVTLITTSTTAATTTITLTRTSSTSTSSSSSSSSTSTSNNSPISTTRTTSQTPSPTTFQTMTTTAPPAGGPIQNLYGQCGGSNYAGPTRCPDYASCATVNPYYAQCTPGPVPAGAQSLYGQCGGMNWPAESPTSCVPGATCKTANPYYAQCTPV